MKHLGYLILYRIADLAAPYAALSALASATGFDPACLPTPPTPFSAWQKATNLRRQKLIPPQALVEQIQTTYQCNPTVQAETKIVSSTLRHILRSVTVPKAHSKNSQVDVEPVAILQFDENGLSDPEKFVSSYPHDDPLAAVNGNVDCLIHRMRLEYERQLTTADGQDIRAGVRKYLDNLGAILLTDGTYFTPTTEGLPALQAYILGLSKWRRGEGVITCQVYPVIDDGSLASSQNQKEITAAAAAHFQAELKHVSELAQPDGRGMEASKARLKRAEETLSQIERRIGEYEAVLGELGLSQTIGHCRQELRAAQEVLASV